MSRNSGSKCTDIRTSDCIVTGKTSKNVSLIADFVTGHQRTRNAIDHHHRQPSVCVSIQNVLFKSEYRPVWPGPGPACCCTTAQPFFASVALWEGVKLLPRKTARGQIESFIHCDIDGINIFIGPRSEHRGTDQHFDWESHRTTGAISPSSQLLNLELLLFIKYLQIFLQNVTVDIILLFYYISMLLVWRRDDPITTTQPFLFQFGNIAYV